MFGLVGTGAGIIAIFIAWQIMRHAQHLPSAAHPWALRAAVVLSFMGGADLALSAVGGWGSHVINWAASLGGAGVAAVTCITLFLLALVAFGVWAAHTPKAVYAAALLPLFLLASGAGALHQLGVSTVAPAQQETATIQSWLTGR